LRYFIELCYNGKNYKGWQVQPNGNSVQGTLEKALSLLLKEEVSVVGCGRTDAGVHAEQFYLHFDTQRTVDKEKLKFRLNSFLPEDIAILDVLKVREDAHARFDAVSRTYQYRMHLGKDPFRTDVLYQIPEQDLDLETMNRAADLLRQHRDFKCFSRSRTDVKTYDCAVAEAGWIREGESWIFQIRANRFLRNMVRAVVGTLLEVGKGHMDLQGFQVVLDSRDRSRAGASVKAKGLFLTKVEYPEEIFSGS